jgi:LPXTG-motif cell wall-anchored protein
MATIINNPDTGTTDNGMGVLLGVIVFIIFAILFFIYGLPYLANSFSQPAVQVPDKVDVNVNTPQK